MSVRVSLLRVSEVRKSFGRTQVLDGASMEVRAGELVGIVGENGSGKSTLLEIIVGQLGRSGGTVEVEGTLGYCPQKVLTFEQLTVWENFRYFGTAYGLDDWEQRCGELARRYRFAAYLDRLVKQVSGGTKQKLNLAISLMHAPTLLVLDEPYAGLDWESYLVFWEHAVELQAQGRGLLVVSHFLHDRERFDRVYTLERGLLRCD
jgi:ABC-2 type transport system ATP-binding protein